MSTRRAARRPVRPYRPQFDRLEDRVTPSVSAADVIQYQGPGNNAPITIAANDTWQDVVPAQAFSVSGSKTGLYDFSFRATATTDLGGTATANIRYLIDGVADPTDSIGAASAIGAAVTQTAPRGPQVLPLFRDPNLTSANHTLAIQHFGPRGFRC